MSQTKKFEYDSIVQSANGLLTQVDIMKTTLNSIKETVDGTKQCFNSAGGDSARRKFQRSADNFAKYETFMRSFGEYLLSFAAMTKELDEATVQGFEELPEFGN